MISRSRATLLPAFVLGASLLSASCSDANAGTGAVRPAAPANAPLAKFQGELLDLAFQTASAFPKVPYVKDRAQAQDAVVRACLELDQPERALAYAKQIDNWRRGAGYAEYALYCAEKGDASAAQRHIDLAREVYETTEKDNLQDWQRDEIRGTIAKAFRSLGRDAEANVFETDAEGRPSRPSDASLADPQAFDGYLQGVDAAVEANDFDRMRGTLSVCARLFDVHYADPALRTRAEEKIKASWNMLPITIRVDLLIELAESALAHADQAKALALVGDVGTIMETSTWKPELRIPVVSRLVEIRHRAGDAAGARMNADAALASFEADREKINDYKRAETLVPLAEAYQAIGDPAAALRVYAKAVHEGALNVNSRPRAEDLCATSCSMAVQGVEPDPELLARMQEIGRKLRESW